MAKKKEVDWGDHANAQNTENLPFLEVGVYLLRVDSVDFIEARNDDYYRIGVHVLESYGDKATSPGEDCAIMYNAELEPATLLGILKRFATKALRISEDDLDKGGPGKGLEKVYKGDNHDSLEHAGSIFVCKKVPYTNGNGEASSIHEYPYRPEGKIVDALVTKFGQEQAWKLVSEAPNLSLQPPESFPDKEVDDDNL